MLIIFPGLGIHLTCFAMFCFVLLCFALFCFVLFCMRLQNWYIKMGQKGTVIILTVTICLPLATGKCVIIILLVCQEAFKASYICIN